MSTHTAAADRWRKIIREQQTSGMSALAYCRRAGVPQSSFFVWRKKLRGEVTFTEVKVSPAPVKSGRIELRLPGGRCVVVRPGFDRRTLIELLTVLETGGSEVAAAEAQG
jgi:hypothetical protein